MVDSDELKALSTDDLWHLHNEILELLVAKMKERSRELDIFLAKIEPRSDSHAGARQRTAA
jgi:hypothetical protein